MTDGRDDAVDPVLRLRWKTVVRDDGVEYIWRREFTGDWEHWFTVKQSQIPGAGKGLFAARHFRDGVTLGRYDGPAICDAIPRSSEAKDAMLEMIAKDSAGGVCRMDSEARYVFATGEGDRARLVNGGDEESLAWRSGMARINDAGSFKNAVMRATGRIVVGLKSKGDKPQKRDIFAGEEIFMEYGKGRDEDGTETYWFRWGGERFNPEPPRGPAREAIKGLRARLRAPAPKPTPPAPAPAPAPAAARKKRERPDAEAVRVTRARTRAQSPGLGPVARMAPKRERVVDEAERVPRKAPRILRGAAGP